ncbi:MAG: hypothetical protein JWO86_3113 [Myxococcaceae bacterium]|nr:hypothetical protein [Myxococcaceae bacterium]
MSLTKLVSSSVASSSWVMGLSAIALTTTLVACVIEDAPPRRLAGDPTPATPVGTATPVGSGTGTVGGTPSADPTGVSPSPILAIVDTDQVMNADPGEGVGVFTEYSGGGKWHVWWTCDTAKSQLQCDVALSVTAASGTISNLDSTALDNGSAQLSNASRIDAQTTTTTQVHGIRFDTNPGAVITLEATVGGLREGPGPNRSFFFFVQDGKINGGFTGRLSNPLQLQGKTP